MKNRKAVDAIASGIKNAVFANLNAISEEKKRELFTVDTQDTDALVDKVFNIFSYIEGALLSSVGEDLSKYPKFQLNCVYDISTNSIKGTLKTPPRNEMPAKITFRYTSFTDLNKVYNDTVETAVNFAEHLLYRQYAIENCKEFTEILNKALVDVPFGIKVAYSDSEEYVTEITDKNITFAVDLNRAFLICQLPVICLDSENEYAQAQAKNYVDSLIAEIKREQTTVRYLKSSSNFIKTFIGTTRKGAVALLKQTYNRDFTKMKKGIGYVSKEVNGVKVFAICEKVATEGTVTDSYVLPPFNTEDLSFVDIDIKTLLATE